MFEFLAFFSVFVRLIYFFQRLQNNIEGYILQERMHFELFLICHWVETICIPEFYFIFYFRIK